METIHKCLTDTVSKHIRESTDFVTKEEIVKKDAEVINEVINEEIHFNNDPNPIFHQALFDYWANRLIFTVDVGNSSKSMQERMLKDLQNKYWNSTPVKYSFVTTDFAKKIHE